jgi:glutaredoxin
MLELYVVRTCPFCGELREQLELDGSEFREYDVEADPEARERFLALCGADRIVPLLIEDGRIKQSGWEGRGCAIGR